MLPPVDDLITEYRVWMDPDPDPDPDPPYESHILLQLDSDR